MNEILERIARCVEAGKINKASPYPPDMKGQDGVDELTGIALQSGSTPGEILELALIPAMENVGIRFSRKEIFVPQMLLSAKAMSASMAHLKPYFLSGETKRKGTFVIGTVTGDLHDIGKNLVAMMVEGGGWEVVDLGVDVGAVKFLQALEKHPSASVGLSALLTTTMENMRNIVQSIKQQKPETRILVGGAPLTQDFCDRIGADHYSPDPQGAVDYLKTLVS